VTIGILGFLKEYSKRPTLAWKDVAAHLGKQEEEASDYMRKFAYLVVNTVSEPDFPTRVRNVLNKNTMDEDVLVTSEEIDKLRPSVESYLGYKLKKAEKTLKKPESEDISNTSKKVSFIEDERDELQDTPQRPPKQEQKKSYQLNDEPEPMYSEYGYGRDERNQEYARLSNSGRSELLRYALQKSPYVHKSKVDNFISLFETDERELMLHPEKLYRLMTKVFGPEAGDISFNSFKAILKNFAQPEQGFGVDPYTMRGGGYGQEGQQQQGPISYYHAQGILPTGLSPQDPVARRIIEEYEDRKREEHQDRMFDKKMKRMLDAQMMNVLDPQKQAMMQGQQRFGQQGPLTDQYQTAVQMGFMVPVQTQHPDGSVTTRYEPKNGMMNGQLPTDPIKSNIETVKMMSEIFTTLKGGAQGPESMMNTIMTKWAEQAFQPQPNQVEQFVNLKKVMDTVSPPGNPQFGMQAAEIAIRQKRLELDADFANRREDREEGRVRFEREQADRSEQRSHDQLKETMSGVKDIGKELIPYVFPLLFKGALGGAAGAPGAAAAGGAGGLGALGQMLGPLLQGGGLGKLLQGGAGGGPEDMDLSSLLGGGPQQQPQYNPQPYGAPPPQQYQQPPPQPQQPEQPQQVVIQQVPQQEQPKTQYSPADFDKYDLNTLQELKAQGLGNESAIDSFLSSINIAINKKAMSTRQQPQVIVQQQPEAAQASVVTPEDVAPQPDLGPPMDEDEGAIG
jgi:hypothetical protein